MNNIELILAFSGFMLACSVAIALLLHRALRKTAPGPAPAVATADTGTAGPRRLTRAAEWAALADAGRTALAGMERSSASHSTASRQIDAAEHSLRKLMGEIASVMPAAEAPALGAPDAPVAADAAAASRSSLAA